MKKPKQLERYFKGASNHRRINIIIFVHDNPGITLEGITKKVNGNFKTISEHTRKLVQAGLLNKKYVGHMVAHSLSPYGQKFYKFINTF